MKGITNSYKIVIDTIAELAKKSSKEPIEIPEIDDEIKELPSKIAKKYKNDLKKVYETKEKKKRVEDLQKIRNQISEEFLSDKLSSVVINDSIKYVERDIVRGELL